MDSKKTRERKKEENKRYAPFIPYMYNIYTTQQNMIRYSQ